MHNPEKIAAFNFLLDVFLQEAQAYAEENSLLFMETSAKTAMNVNDIFLAIGKKMIGMYFPHNLMKCYFESLIQIDK